MKIMILGYKGFLGSHLNLVEGIKEIPKILPSRSFSKIEKKGNDLLVPFSKVWEVAYDEKPEVLINLVGILKESYKGEYEEAHIEIARKISSFCLSNPSTRVVHISAIGPQSCPQSPYFKTKRKAEKLIMDISRNAIILRPGIIFGEGQKMFSQIKTISTLSPLLFCPDSKTAVVDVKRIANIIYSAAIGEINPGIYEVYDRISDLKTFFQMALEMMGIKRKVIALPEEFFWPAALLGEIFPFIPINMAQYKTLSCHALPCGLYPEL